MDGQRPTCTIGNPSGSPHKPRSWASDGRFPDGSYYRSEMKEHATFSPSPMPSEMMQFDPLPVAPDVTSTDIKHPCFARQRSNDSSMMGISPTPTSPMPTQFNGTEVWPRAKEAKRSRQHRDSLDPQHRYEAEYEDVSTSLKKVCLPTPETRSVRIKTLTGRTTQFEYAPFLCLPPRSR